MKIRCPNASRKSHWERVHASGETDEVSWYQPIPAKSLALIRQTGVPLTAPILDVGSGTSALVDHLLQAGYRDVSALDIASSALAEVRDRLGTKSSQVTWIEADITEFESSRSYSVWHDRAVFHFLTNPVDRKRYLDILSTTLQAQGYFVLATFGPDGPTRCSGLEIQRYSVEQVSALLGPDFRLRTNEIEEHRTPSGMTQQFLYGCWQLET